MKYRLIYILLSISIASLWVGCSDQEILTTYEEVKEAAAPVPLSFTPYISSNVSTEVTTRADLNYLNNIYLDGSGQAKSNFYFFPWFNESAAIGKSWDEVSIDYHVGAKSDLLDYRFGNFINNSYIVGLYGYHGMEGETQLDWDAMKYNTNLTSNFMTNQPLLHTASGNNWNYTPLRYWPNSTNKDAKVTFVSYYPFQDFKERTTGIDDNGIITGNGYYRDGSSLVNGGHLADLTCITPPAKDAKGKAAYTFTFKQHKKIEDHVDFLLGINPDITKQNVGTGIGLTLKHALCGVMFDLRSNGVTAPGATSVTIKVNSVSLEGLYGKGKVYPTSSGVVWEDLEDKTTYTFAFTPENVSDIFHNEFNSIIFNNTTIRYNRRLIYENIKGANGGGVGIVNGVNLANSDFVENARGMKYMMMVIPQKVNDNSDAFLVVNYDITYNYGGSNAIVYKNNEEKIKLKDEKKKSGEGDTSQLFIAGKIIAFNIIFDSPKAITMDAELMDWDEGEGPEEEGGNGVPVPHEWEDQMDREQEEGGTP